LTTKLPLGQGEILDEKVKTGNIRGFRGSRIPTALSGKESEAGLPQGDLHLHVTGRRLSAVAHGGARRRRYTDGRHYREMGGLPVARHEREIGGVLSTKDKI